MQEKGGPGLGKPCKHDPAGGEVEVRTVESLGSLGKKFDVVINCAGLGARWAPIGPQSLDVSKDDR